MTDSTSLERLRLSVAAVWMVSVLFVATVLQLTWRTGAVMIALGLIAPVALLILWNHSVPSFPRRSRDPRL